MPPIDKISHYELHDLLGEGGMGRVYRAVDVHLDRPVAIKLLTEKTLGDPAFLERFRREARLAAQLNHPNIATIYEFGEENGLAFLAMEFVEGKTIRQLVQGRGLSVEDVRFLGGQAARAIGAAHARGIVHRDIKTANLMLTGDGNLKVMDFGVARRQGDTQLTSAGALVGTAHIMAPEIIQGREPGPEADLFSLGCVLYEMLTGHFAFAGDDAMAVLYQVMNQDPLPLTEYRDDVPEDIEELIAALLVKDPAERYGPAEAVAHALEFPGVPWTPPAPPPPLPPVTEDDATVMVDEATARSVASSSALSPGTGSWVRPLSSSSRVRTGFTGTPGTGVVPGQDPGAVPGTQVTGVAAPTRRSPLFAVVVTVIIIAAAAGSWFLWKSSRSPDQGNRNLAFNLNERGAAVLRRLPTVPGQAHPESVSIARTFFLDSIEADESYSTAWNNLAELSRLEGKPQAAKEQWERALALKPDNAAARINLAGILEVLGDLEGAEREYRQALKDDVSLSATPNNLGFLLLEQGRNQEAKEILASATRSFPEVAPLWKNYGLSLERLGRHVEAREAFERAVRLIPGYPASVAGLARVAEATGDTTGAAGHWRTLLGRGDPALADTARAHLEALGTEPR